MHCTMKFARLSVLAATVAAVSACGGSEPDMTRTTLAKRVSNVQCEPPKVTLQALDAELVNAGVAVLANRCAWDGLFQPAVCGAESAYLRVIEISKYQEPLVRLLGYLAPDEFPGFIASGCPSQ